MNGDSCRDIINDNDAEIEYETEISIVTSKDIYKLIASFKGFLRKLPVIGYISGRYSCTLTKGSFPYEWVTSLRKLDCEFLPPKKPVLSELKNEVMSDRNYAYCEQIWRNHDMKNFVIFSYGIAIETFCFLKPFKNNSSDVNQSCVPVLQMKVTFCVCCHT